MEQAKDRKHSQTTEKEFPSLIVPDGGLVKKISQSLQAEGDERHKNIREKRMARHMVRTHDGLERVGQRVEPMPQQPDGKTLPRAIEHPKIDDRGEEDPFARIAAHHQAE